MTEDIEEGCGYSWDHDLQLIDQADGETVYECRECGVEIRETETD